MLHLFRKTPDQLCWAMLEPSLLPLKVLQKTTKDIGLCAHSPKRLLRTLQKQQPQAEIWADSHWQHSVDVLFLSLTHKENNWLSYLQKQLNRLKPGGLLIWQSLLYTEVWPHCPSLHAMGDALAQSGCEGIVVGQHKQHWQFSSLKMKKAQLDYAGIDHDENTLQLRLCFAHAHAFKKTGLVGERHVGLPRSRQETHSETP